MKNKKIALLLTLLSLGLASCGDISNAPTFDPWDQLDGGKEGSVGEIIDLDNQDYEPGSNVVINSNQTTTDESEAIPINLSNLTSTQYSITKAGTYILSGQYQGSIIIESCNDQDVHIILNNVNIAPKDTSSLPAILFKKTTGLRVLTIKDHTTNYLKDSTGDYGIDYDEAVICSRRSSLTINGTGTLNIEAKGANSTGIKVKEKLTLLSTNVNIISKNHGIKADDQIIIKDAKIHITTTNDGIKTGKDPLNDEEALLFSSSGEYGYLYIENTSLDILSGDDGISANNTLYINNNDTNLINITSNNGTPETVNQTSSNNVDGKAIRVEGINLVDLVTLEETYYPATFEENYTLVIKGGRFNLNSNDDAIQSKGNIMITGGEFDITSGDDGIHADYLFHIDEGLINVNKSYEGLEAAAIEIFGGEINITSIDDGINASNSELANFDYHIYIENGSLNVNANGDGIDSNGWMEMNGGNVTIFGPTKDKNSALDSNKGVVINGGNLIAFGPAGMVENPASNSTQCFVNVTTPMSQEANSNLLVKSSEGTELVNLSSSKRYQSVIISLESFEVGSTFTFEVGNQNYQVTLEKIATALGVNSNGLGNQGQHRPHGK